MAAFNLLRGDLSDLPHEEFWVLLVNRANRLIKKKRVSEGGVSGTVADPKIIFKLALDELACGIVVAHYGKICVMSSAAENAHFLTKLAA